MIDESNVTYITLGGHVEFLNYRYLYFTIMFIVYILIICCNSSIVYIIWIRQNLHEPMYIFIASLLINSVLFSTAIYPKLLIDFLSEKQIISYPACLFQSFLCYSLIGSEFLLLAVMSYDRYVSICKPLQYATIMRNTTVIICLALAWLVPACELMALIIMNATQHICKFTLKVIFCNNSINKLYCANSQEISVYGVFILINVGLLPLLFILFTYAKIFKVTLKSSREVRRKAAETCLPHLLVLSNFFLSVTFDVVTIRLEFDISKTARLIMTLQLILYSPLFNPIMYGVKMKEISKHIKRFFCQNKMN